MHLSADEICANAKEGDFPNIVGFWDHAAKYCVVLSRFSDLEPDDGTISVMVQDQIHAHTSDLTVHLERSRCSIRLDYQTTAKLLGIREYIVDFRADDENYRQLVQLLRIIFQDLPGLTVEEA